jgi:hypothetical protein
MGPLLNGGASSSALKLPLVSDHGAGAIIAAGGRRTPLALPPAPAADAQPQACAAADGGAQPDGQ